MVCCHDVPIEGRESAFAVDRNAITFGRGVLAEVGPWAKALGLSRVAVVTDPRVAKLEPFGRALSSLGAAGIDVALYDEVKVEPTDRSFRAATRFAVEAKVDGFISIGGGSVVDTAKAANLYATHPAELLTYVNAPVGEGRPIPGPLRPHIACPTTSGTGSECTGIAIFDLLSLKAKTGIANRHLVPTRALIDPDTTETLPGPVVAASGFDVLSHALESFTARPFTARSKTDPLARPLSQGANPWSDLGCREALRLCGRYLVRAVQDPSDREARESMMWAATLAGTAFGNAGVHVPHGMSYAVAGLVESFSPDGYPKEEPIVPHGMSVIVNAPAVFRRIAARSPERHLEAAELLGADVRDAEPGEAVSGRIAEMMKATGMPNGISGVGYDRSHVAALTEGAIVQRRLLDNAPVPIDRELLAGLFEDALTCW
ncbi:MAG TPA: hydroxyacid-oxoacid transhydrogenase [Actinomycetota bacterium]|nr:hydroxyacid-oxoacid transhydrogenase [Actinomycetota bacterium]